MSERGEIEVLMPVNWTPSTTERIALGKQAFAEARRLLPNGRVLGVSKLAFAETIEGRRALRFTFSCIAPEGTWHHRKSFAT